MRIIGAEKSDAPNIGRVIVSAIGDDLAESLAGEHTVDDVTRLFSTLAARDDSQYSYRNTLKAIDSNGNPMGYIIGYDGELLHELRKAFFKEAFEILGIEFDGPIADECKPDEFYLDSLAVFPDYRGRGVATKLIEAMAEKSRVCGKPLGLLCAKDNSRARKLYTGLGFRKVGESFFAGELMDHLQRI